METESDEMDYTFIDGNSETTSTIILSRKKTTTTFTDGSSEVNRETYVGYSEGINPEHINFPDMTEELPEHLNNLHNRTYQDYRL